MLSAYRPLSAVPGAIRFIVGAALGRPIRYTSPSFPAFWRRLRPRVSWDTLLFMTIVYTLARRGRNVIDRVIHESGFAARLINRHDLKLLRMPAGNSR